MWKQYNSLVDKLLILLHFKAIINSGIYLVELYCHKHVGLLSFLLICILIDLLSVLDMKMHNGIDTEARTDPECCRKNKLCGIKWYTVFAAQLICDEVVWSAFLLSGDGSLK